MTLSEFRKALRQYEEKDMFNKREEYIQLFYKLIEQVKPEKREMAKSHFERHYYDLV